jgi:hypothetical protein
VKRRRAREHDQDVAREQADRRREELLARLRGEKPGSGEPEAEAEAAVEEAQPAPAASDDSPVQASPEDLPEVPDVRQDAETAAQEEEAEA